MAKKHPPKGQEDKPAADFYKLHTQAVDDLVSADETNAPPVSEEELRRYGARKKHGIPNGVKICFIKFWFPAAVCYFFFWGLGGYVSSMLDLMFVTAIALGMVTDLLTNNVLRFFAETEGANDRWMMFPKKRYATFFLNILYAFVLLFMVFCIYTGINQILIALTAAPAGSVPLGVEPILFGAFYLLCDTALVAVKNLCAGKLRGAKNKNV